MKNRNLFILMFTVLTLYNCAATSELTTANGSKNLSNKINSVLVDSKLNTNTGIHIVSLNSGETLYSRNAENLFTPASNNKLYTAAAALHYLIPNFKFETKVLVDEDYQNTNHVPRLVLVGGGDPDLFISDFEVIAQEISNKINIIDTLIVDNSLFDDIDFGPGWMWDEGSAWYAAHIDAMSFNDNCVDISVAPGNVGKAPLISISPYANFDKIINNAITVDDTTDYKDLKIERKWQEHINVIEITGELMADAETDIYYRNIENPALFAGTVLQNLLSSHNTQVNNLLVSSRDSNKLIPLYIYYSQPFTESLGNFMQASDNLSGELFIKMIGHITTGEQGNWNNGIVGS